jgi:2-dehydro-3-deoxyphosphogluconate aldolase/(4S)-4-hydroxy-2-oxoglutarate aldolase
MRGLETDRCIDIAAAMADSGLAVVEVTMDSPDAARTIAALVSRGHTVGAGTVMSIGEAHEAIDAGAAFLVAPHTDDAVVRWAVDQQYPMVPGAFTPSEVLLAWNLGASAVKLFPASIGGADLVKSIAAPFGHIPLMVTGGIDASNVASFLVAGASAAGVGGWLVGQANLDVVRERAALLVAAVESANV